MNYVILYKITKIYKQDAVSTLMNMFIDISDKEWPMKFG